MAGSKLAGAAGTGGPKPGSAVTPAAPAPLRAPLPAAGRSATGGTPAAIPPAAIAPAAANPGRAVACPGCTVAWPRAGATSDRVAQAAFGPAAVPGVPVTWAAARAPGLSSA